RFRSDASLLHPASTIRRLAAPAGSETPADMEVSFFGVVGPLGVLPHAYTELLLERGRNKDEALRGFLDLFHHRLLSYFYRAWEKYRFAVAFERGEGDILARYLWSLLGLGTEGLRRRMEVPDEALLFFAGVLARRPRCAAALEGALGDYFGVRASVLPLTGGWAALDPEDRTRLGVQDGGSIVGRATVLGERIWHPQGGFRVQVGALRWDRLLEFLPGRSAFRELSAFVRFYVGIELDFDVVLVLRAEEAGGIRLGGTGAAGAPLGWASWLVSGPSTRDLRTASFPCPSTVHEEPGLRAAA
ncbi:MAG TPA: type VI secretion system baseplate subunit TssG, partial [Planctomycetota bacterium]|nr:type VI secretion system baseplate subunit TssG [Planctomycetota bacterium]